MGGSALPHELGRRLNSAVRSKSQDLERLPIVLARRRALALVYPHRDPYERGRRPLQVVGMVGQLASRRQRILGALW